MRMMFVQMAWYRDTAASLAAQTDGVLPPALAYFHIPIDEYLQVSGWVRYTITNCHTHLIA